MTMLVDRDLPIAIVAPCHPHRADRFERGLSLIEEAGWCPEPYPKLLEPRFHLAAPDEHRRTQLADALTDPRFGAVWIARGGSGLTRLLSGLPLRDLPPRPVIGFSDATALLVALYQSGHRGPLIHGPVVHSLGMTDSPSREHLFRLLAGETTDALVGTPWVGGQAEGPLTGGNLSLLAALCGTPWQPDAQGHVLVIEEVGEPAYRIYRMFQQLDDAGVFRGVAAIALGTFVDCSVPSGASWTLADMLRDRLASLRVPVLAELPIGHGPANRSFPLGARALVGHGTLSWQEPLG